MNTSTYLKFVVLVMITLSYPLLSSLNNETITEVTKEDHLVENFSAIFYLLCSSISFFVYYKGGKNIFYFLFSVFFAICFGEEISWGQRIFEISTPDSFKHLNIQGEINIHNLSFFNNNGDKTTLRGKILSVLTSANGLYSIFWIFYAVLLPIILKYFRSLNELAKRILFPVFPVWLGAVFVLNFAIFKLYESCSIYANNSTPIVELKESNIAFLYLVGFLFFYCKENCKIVTFLSD